jgi:hypothetical protein
LASDAIDPELQKRLEEIAQEQDALAQAIEQRNAGA